jgi:iron(III) transport system substrate-binding protein
VLIVNTERVPEPGAVNSIHHMVDPAWPGPQVGLAYPLFGTTATHAAALYESWGPEAARQFFTQLAEHDVRVVDGNSVVRDMVVSGQLAFGLTDTDDACGALARGAPVAVVLPDQDGLGALVIPGTVALIAGAPHPQPGQALIDYLLRPEVEQTLVEASFSHIPVHSGLKIATPCIATEKLRGMAVDYGAVYRHLEQVQTELREIFLR